MEVSEPLEILNDKDSFRLDFLVQLVFEDRINAQHTCWVTGSAFKKPEV